MYHVNTESFSTAEPADHPENFSTADADDPSHSPFYVEQHTNFHPLAKDSAMLHFGDSAVSEGILLLQPHDRSERTE